MFLLLSCLNDWIIDIDGCNFSPEVFTLKMSVFIVVGQVRVGASLLSTHLLTSSLLTSYCLDQNGDAMHSVQSFYERSNTRLTTN